MEDSSNLGQLTSRSRSYSDHTIIELSILTRHRIRVGVRVRAARQPQVFVRSMDE